MSEDVFKDGNGQSSGTACDRKCSQLDEEHDVSSYFSVTLSSFDLKHDLSYQVHTAFPIII